MGGTVLNGAVFQDEKGQQTFIALHEKLPDGSKIIRLREDSISLKGPDGAVYEMFIARDTKTPGAGSAPARAVSTPAPQPAVSLQQPVQEAKPDDEPRKIRSKTRQGGEKRASRTPPRKGQRRAPDSDE